MWNLEKWYRWTYLQGRNRDADIENRCVDMVEGEEKGGMNWEIGIDIHTLTCIKWITNENLLYKKNKLKKKSTRKQYGSFPKSLHWFMQVTFLFFSCRVPNDIPICCGHLITKSETGSTIRRYWLAPNTQFRIPYHSRGENVRHLYQNKVFCFLYKSQLEGSNVHVTAFAPSIQELFCF